MAMIMERTQLIDLAGERKLTRRTMLQSLAAAGVAVTGPMMLPRAARAADMPTYFTWGGYDIPEMVQPFIDAHGEPGFAAYADASEALQKLRAGFVADVAHPCISDIRRYKAADIFQPVDTSRLSNWNDLFEPLRTTEGQVDEDGVWLVPIDWGATAITIRSDLVDMSGREPSYAMLWDEEFRDRISMIIGMSDSWMVAAILEGLDITNLEGMTEEQIQQVNKKLREQRPLVRTYWSDATSLNQAMASGEVIVALTWNETAPTLRREGVPAEFLSPKEGPLTWFCGAMLHKDAPYPDKAHDLIDALIDPTVGEYIITEFGYGHSNTKTFDRVSTDTLADMGVPTDPISFLQGGHYLIGMPEDIATRLNRDWEQIMAGF